MKTERDKTCGYHSMNDMTKEEWFALELAKKLTKQGYSRQGVPAFAVEMSRDLIDELNK